MYMLHTYTYTKSHHCIWDTECATEPRVARKARSTDKNHRGTPADPRKDRQATPEDDSRAAKEAARAREQAPKEQGNARKRFWPNPPERSKRPKKFPCKTPAKGTARRPSQGRRPAKPGQRDSRANNKRATLGPVGHWTANMYTPGPEPHAMRGRKPQGCSSALLYH